MGPDSAGSEEIQRFEDQYRSQPDSLVFARLADAYRKAGQPEKALAVLEDGLLRHPDYPSGHIVRARTLRDLGRMDEALQAFRRVLELDASNLVAIRELAGLADERGDADETRHWLERLTQIDPTNDEARERLAELGTGGPWQPGDEAELPSVELEVEGPAETEGPSAWWDDSAVDLATSSLDAGEDEEAPRPEDEVVEAILNGDLPRSVRVEDTWWYEEAPSREDPEPSQDADLLTRTMADLYAEQGLHREAAEIYEELLKDSPDDADLLARLDAARLEAPVEPDRQADEDQVPVPEPIGRSVGTPWVEELRGLLRAGEESAKTLPDPGPNVEEAPADLPLDPVPDTAADDSVSVAGPGKEEVRPGGEEVRPAEPSRFATEWLEGLKEDG